MRRPSQVLAVALLALAPGAFAEGIFLHTIPIDVQTGAAAAGAASLRVAPREDASLARALAPYAPVDEADPADFLAASFLIDFDEPAVDSLRRALIEHHGPSPSLAELVRFTHDAVAHKTFSRGFDLASQVARHRTGDCTEHAVLLTALARSVKRPARVVLGIALLSEGSRIAAYGHAWAEIHDGDGWRVGEATGLPGDEVLGYVPVGAVGNEGPGFALGLMGPLQAAWFRGVDVGLSRPGDTP